MINIRCWATATAAIRHGGPWEPESEVTLAPASLSLSEAIAKGSASKFALISSARSTHKSAAFLCAWPSAYANGRLPKLARIFEFYKKKEKRRLTTLILRENCVTEAAKIQRTQHNTYTSMMDQIIA